MPSFTLPASIARLSMGAAQGDTTLLGTWAACFTLGGGLKGGHAENSWR